MAIGSVPLLMLFTVVAAEQPAEFTFNIKKQADQVTAKVTDDRTLFDIYSPSGIGAVTITPTQGKWPKNCILRLHLKGLESLKISMGAVTLGTNSRRVFLLEAQNREIDVERNSPYWTAVKQVTTETEEYEEIALPDELFKKSPKSIQVEWIDFFR